jgi:hypothetical protein
MSRAKDLVAQRLIRFGAKHIPATGSEEFLKRVPQPGQDRAKEKAQKEQNSISIA